MCEEKCIPADIQHVFLHFSPASLESLAAGTWEEFSSKHMLPSFLSECFRLYQKAQSELHKPEKKIISTHPWG